MLADLYLAWRALRRSPGYLVAAVCTLALGVGLNTALFGIVDGVLLRPLPYRDPERLVVLSAPFAGTSKAVATAFAERTGRAFAGVAYASPGASDATLLGGGGEPVRVGTSEASGNLFAVLGVVSARGRTLRPGDERPGGARVAVVSDRLWRDRFGADARVVGRTITLDGVPREVVGVLPASFAYPAPGVDVWTPAVVDRSNIGDFWWQYRYRVVARLRPGVTLAAASAAMRAALPDVRAAVPFPLPSDWGVADVGARGLLDATVGGARPTLYALWGAVGLLLAAACVNAANLALARAAARAREGAVRAAIGASPTRLLRPVLAEHGLLAMLAAALGAAIAAMTTRALGALVPADLPRAAGESVDWRMLAFAVAAAVAASVAAAIAPSLRTARSDVRGLLSDGARGASAGRARRRTADVLVVAQVALAVVLAVGAGLLGRSVTRLLAERPGFRPEGAAALELTLPAFPSDTSTRGRVYYETVLARVRALPGVQTAAVTSALPIDVAGGAGGGVLRVESHPTPEGQQLPEFTFYDVSPGYLRAAGIPLSAGRDFTDGDGPNASPVVLIDSTAAAAYWPERRGDVVGQRVQSVTGGPWRTVVGVVGAVRRDSLSGTAAPTVYTPIAQSLNGPPRRARLVVRGDPAAVRGTGLAALRSAVRAVDASAPVGTPRPLADFVAETAGQQRFAALLASLFAAAALALGAVGVYGVVAYATSVRTRELGVRSALGASTRDLRGLVLADGGRLALWGALTGLAAALAGGRLIRTLLYGVSPGDPAVFLGVPVLLGLVTLAACLLPALRAGRVSPLVAMRAE